MTTARALTLGALVVVAALVAILLLGGNGAHQYKLVFQTAGQLVKDNDVQVGGRRVGSVEGHPADRRQPGRDHDRGRQALRAAARGHDGGDPRDVAVGRREPLHRAQPGTEQRAQARRRRGRSRADKTTTIVDLDQLFNTLDAPTRKGLADIIQGFATRYAGKGVQANAAGALLPARAVLDARPARRSSTPTRPR